MRAAFRSPGARRIESWLDASPTRLPTRIAATAPMTP